MIAALTRRNLILLAGAGSAALLASAFAFQYIGGLAPCAMCLWQRWPHAAAIAIAALGAALPHAALAALGALTMLINAGLSLFHTGVERDWWDGPTSCTGGGGDGISDMSVGDLLNPDIGTAIVMCDDVAWSLLGLSMASWNGVACIALAAIWSMAARARSAT